MNVIFVDTWAWYALADRHDQDHMIAQLANEELLDKGYTFVTTNFVLDEALTMIRYNLGHTVAVQFWQQIQELMADELIEYIRVDQTIERAAWQIFKQYADQDFSFTDCTSFAVMHERNVTQVFTADHHFRTMSFTLTP